MGGAAALMTISSTGELSSTMTYNDGMRELSINYDLITGNDPLKRDEIMNAWMKKNQEAMDRDYGRPEFHPEWYGLIIIDNQNKRILDYQGYTKLMSTSLIGLEMVKSGRVIGSEDDVMYDWHQLTKFIIAKKAYIELYDSSKNEFKRIEIKELNIPMILKNYNKDSAFGIHNLKFDHDWEFIDFEHEPNGIKAYYEYCQKHYNQFLTKKSHDGWKEYIKSHGDDD